MAEITIDATSIIEDIRVKDIIGNLLKKIQKLYEINPLYKVDYIKIHKLLYLV